MRFRFNMALMLIAISFFIFAPKVHAQVWAQWDCVPKTAFMPTASGTAYHKIKTDLGESYGWFCQTSPTTWKPNYFTCLKKYCVHADPWGALTRLATNASMTSINGELAAASIAPANAQEDYEFRTLQRAACIALTAQPYLAPITPPAPDFCPSAPIPPATDVFKTPATGQFTLFSFSGGRITGQITGRKSGPGLLCDCTKARATLGLKVYCSVSVPTEVTECQKQ